MWWYPSLISNQHKDILQEFYTRNSPEKLDFIIFFLLQNVACARTPWTLLLEPYRPQGLRLYKINLHITMNFYAKYCSISL